MSMILKGIDIPKEGEWLEVIIKPTKEVIVDTIRYRDNALLKTEYGLVIKIPKGHGRLIDADELKEKRETMCWKDEYYMTHESDFIDSRHIDNAPTILEAET